MSNHQVAHNAVRAGQRYYQSRRKGAERRLRRSLRPGVSLAQVVKRAFEGLAAAMQRATEMMRRLPVVLEAIQKNPSIPLIDRVRLRVALHPGETPFQVARAVGEERVLLVAVMMRMVTLSAERGRVAATAQDSAQEGYSPVDDALESSGSLPASRPVREGH
ncbi:hypothetical protein DAERI_060122 [Deinococcus aerius]|uniref:Uncharacterized protein n=1 Tax=Deinococcus aerius TaxID=200253 RepID=A0A2I9CVD2_9DEIO|nr:hypothetical protein [Deinococcus aerius]GBF05862.1 hypothetical protein DAERI_060122 [Deinococcus aerius]